jgi:hypothetical protein
MGGKCAIRNTYYLIGSWGNTSSTSKATLCGIRRAPQLGQKLLHLQLNAHSNSRFFYLLA